VHNPRLPLLGEGYNASASTYTPTYTAQRQCSFLDLLCAPFICAVPPHCPSLHLVTSWWSQLCTHHASRRRPMAPSGVFQHARAPCPSQPAVYVSNHTPRMCQQGQSSRGHSKRWLTLNVPPPFHLNVEWTLRGLTHG
jgi:hypothetical protein